MVCNSVSHQYSLHLGGRALPDVIYLLILSHLYELSVLVWSSVIEILEEVGALSLRVNSEPSCHYTSMLVRLSVRLCTDMLSDFDKVTSIKL